MKLRLLVLLVGLGVMGCEYGDDGDGNTAIDAAVCFFPSGRPCSPDRACFGGQDNDCNYYVCVSGQPTGTAIACAGLPVTTPADPGRKVNCDPGSIRRNSRTNVGLTPPQQPCPLGQLQHIEGGLFVGCVAVDRCLPWTCEARFGNEGCPSTMVCNAITGMCQAP